MTYLERALQVRTAIEKQPDLVERIQGVFASRIAKDGVHTPFASGNARSVYKLGVCELEEGLKLNLILKLDRDDDRLRFAYSTRFPDYTPALELGAFELYFNFVSGKIAEVAFRSDEAYKHYLDSSPVCHTVSRRFSLADDWGGTMVRPGDYGALPYCHLVVKHKRWFGMVTEGLPPHVAPQYSATDRGSHDQFTVEGGRIIDLGPTQCLLSEIDGFRRSRFSTPYPDALGVRKRGLKFLTKANRLDI